LEAISFSPSFALVAMGQRFYGNRALQSAPVMANKTVVHVVGTGTIGEPLIGLFTDFKAKWGIDEVTFHKRTPKVEDRAMVEHLIGRGGKLVVDETSRDEFNRLGHRVTFTTEEALERATVVVDCTP